MRMTKYMKSFLAHACLAAVYFTLRELIGPKPILQMITAYLLGSIPFGLLLTKMFANVDIRQVGSGNIGATNVLRTGSKGLAIATLFLDALKAAAAVALGSVQGASQEMQLLMGGLAILGHMFPVWLNFKGGKGISSILGVMLISSWKITLVALIVWAIVLWLTRISSASGLAAAAAAPIIGYFLEGKTFMWFLAGMGLLIYARHYENIKRLIQGKEPRIGEKS